MFLWIHCALWRVLLIKRKISHTLSFFNFNIPEHWHLLHNSLSFPFSTSIFSEKCVVDELWKPYDFSSQTAHPSLSLPQNEFHPLKKWWLQYQDSCGLVAFKALPVFKGQDVTTWVNYLDGAVVEKWWVLENALSVADNLSQRGVLGLAPVWELNFFFLI